ncbi:MAG: hypothetical protein LBR73_09080 [Oscillospiraceae bacterium]|jgi:hypothetical protein|nr:hypothetical protein [Oscillospiraceae bacterium]
MSKRILSAILAVALVFGTLSCVFSVNASAFDINNFLSGDEQAIVAEMQSVTDSLGNLSASQRRIVKQALSDTVLVAAKAVLLGVGTIYLDQMTGGLLGSALFLKSGKVLNPSNPLPTELYPYVDLQNGGLSAAGVALINGEINQLLADPAAFKADNDIKDILQETYSNNFSWWATLILDSASFFLGWLAVDILVNYGSTYLAALRSQVGADAPQVAVNFLDGLLALLLA